MSFLQLLLPDPFSLDNNCNTLYTWSFQIKFAYLELSSPWKLTFHILEALQTYSRSLFLLIFLDYLCVFSKPGPSRDAFWCSYSCGRILYPSVA